MDKDLTPWYSLEWFKPDTFKAYHWENAWVLYLLIALVIAFVIRWFLIYSIDQKLPVALTKREIHFSPITLLALIPELLMFLIGSLVILALARPQYSSEKIEQWTEGIDIMVGLDISNSMQMEDFTPNRLEAAKRVAEKFIDGRVRDRIGIVVFAGDAFSLAPLTTDYELLKNYISDISPEMIDTKGTAIGSALAVITNRMRESETKSKVCILLSDGDSNAGNIDPITAADLARAYNIKIYTIIVGREGIVPMGRDPFGRPMQYENTIDETTMRRIAKIGRAE